MIKRKPYRKGRSYFVHIVFQTSGGFRNISARGIYEATHNMTAGEMHDFVLSIVANEMNINLPLDKILVVFYRIEENYENAG